jgi:DNA polymerase-3 subunit epsilon
MWSRWFRRRAASPDRLLALDLEMTGLDATTDRVIAAGSIPIRGGEILWGERWYALVRHEGPVTSHPQALAAHQLLPAETQAGEVTARDVLRAVVERLSDGSALLLHGAAIDLRFLRSEAERAGIAWSDPPVVDTLDYLKRIERASRHAPELEGIGPSTLEQARRRLDLPVYPAHHALVDALATAELYLALRARYPAFHP